MDKANKEKYAMDEQYDVVDIDSFSEMQKLAYDIVKFILMIYHLTEACLINGVAGTGSTSYVI